MAFNRLCVAFRQITINKQGNVIARYLSSHFSRNEHNSPSSYLLENATNVTKPEINIKFAPRTLNINFGNLDNRIIKNIIEIPLKDIPSIGDPSRQRPIQQDLPLTDKILDLPTLGNVMEKQAVRLIVIRRKKMKKHKRKKLRKRMKFQMETIRARRNLKKEKAFQEELLVSIKEAEAFNPKAYVQEKFDILLKERIPKTYRGEVLPPEMIKQFLAERKAKQQKKKERSKFRLTLD
ncbi:uncharacterized protein LOC143215129 [Lasioglossum baleicum]|uniref:uncharacterized protein LOC143215129 n=1 Tax=Lasioglossum baleicum TaxID=434251 RepID=UPI003FCE0F35